ncbi:hypothetical protein KPSA1_07352 [Pseudomonas syringae pv. actinidiae]|uniref:Uncharacterized protein n=1 Tax=Pseudomonas syringae pv. actinidiae TaxID=103796 RepID=A0A2V0QT59_PSESF|nr:hypothetical protein KPSA1_07352 [Pseudomonas syringae pv. actinidiae]
MPGPSRPGSAGQSWRSQPSAWRSGRRRGPGPAPPSSAVDAGNGRCSRRGRPCGPARRRARFCLHQLARR